MARGHPGPATGIQMRWNRAGWRSGRRAGPGSGRGRAWGGAVKERGPARFRGGRRGSGHCSPARRRSARPRPAPRPTGPHPRAGRGPGRSGQRRWAAWSLALGPGAPAGPEAAMKASGEDGKAPAEGPWEECFEAAVRLALRAGQVRHSKAHGGRTGTWGHSGCRAWRMETLRAGRRWARAAEGAAAPPAHPVRLPLPRRGWRRGRPRARGAGRLAGNGVRRATAQFDPGGWTRYGCGVRTRRVEIGRTVCPRVSVVEKNPLSEWRNCCPHQKDEIELRSRRNLRRAALFSRSRYVLLFPSSVPRAWGPQATCGAKLGSAGGCRTQGRLGLFARPRRTAEKGSGDPNGRWTEEEPCPCGSSFSKGRLSPVLQ